MDSRGKLSQCFMSDVEVLALNPVTQSPFFFFFNQGLICNISLCSFMFLTQTSNVPLDSLHGAWSLSANGAQGKFIRSNPITWIVTFQKKRIFILSVEFTPTLGVRISSPKVSFYH